MRDRGIDISLFRHMPAEIRMKVISLAVELSHRPVDVVHCYLDRYCCIGGFAALLCGVPAIRFSWRNTIPSNFSFYREWMPRLYHFSCSFRILKWRIILPPVQQITRSGWDCFRAELK